MTTKNAVGNSLTGSTGSGSFVGATSPTLVTPVLGAATATSINFGQTTLNYHEDGTFTPAFSFDTPGDLSVTYGAQTGRYTRIGRLVYINYIMTFTPTFTTASGTARFTGLPFTVNASAGSGLTLIYKSNNIIFAGTDTMATGFTVESSTYFILRSTGSTSTSSELTTTRFTSGAAHSIIISGVYFV